MGVKVRESTKMMSVQSVLSHILKLHKVWKVLSSKSKCAQVFIICSSYFSAYLNTSFCL